MNASVQIISVTGLVWAFLPVAVVVGILSRWTSSAGTVLHAVARMLIQLLLIGYVLGHIFGTDSPALVLLVLGVMLVAATWIALRPLQSRQIHLYRNTLTAIMIGGGLTLVLVTQVVVAVEPWFSPRYVVTLAGMIFASAMNAVSLAAERFEAERASRADYHTARGIALGVSLIPMINSLFAVGLVSLPGMMTGQIIAGVSPLVAAKYQIVVMCMIFGSPGISAAIYLSLVDRGGTGVTPTRDAPPGPARRLPGPPS